MKINEIDKIIQDLENESKSDEERQALIDLHKRYTGSDEVISSKEYLDKSKKENVLFKVNSGLPSLDEIIGGFRPGTLVIVSGPTKQGKTTFCQTLTKNFTDQKFKCLWLSFDTPSIELIERFNPLPVFYLPKMNSPEKKMDWIEKKVIEGLAKFDTRVIFIDHLGFLTRFTSKDTNHATELTSIVRSLKEISIRWNVIMILNHHIAKIGSDTLPDWTHLKDSSGPGQECDITIMVWRGRTKGKMGDIYTDDAFVSVQLHRRTGKTGIVRVKYKDNLFIEQIGSQTYDL